MQKLTDKIKGLGRYQKGLLLFMAAMVLVFTGIYLVSTGKEGFAYRDTLFFPEKENGTTVYSGRLNGERASFEISEDQSLVFRYGDATYGPYTVKEDPAAVPENTQIQMGDGMTGIALYRGEDLLFRGGATDIGNRKILYDEDGSPESLGILITSGDGTLRDERGNLIDPMEPSASTIVELLSGPQLTHRGEWSIWLEAVAVCIVTALCILFADELFRWSLRLQIRHAEDAEPSDWEIAGRYVGWTALVAMALILFIVGLLI